MNIKKTNKIDKSFELHQVLLLEMDVLLSCYLTSVSLKEKDNPTQSWQ